MNTQPINNMGWETDFEIGITYKDPKSVLNFIKSFLALDLCHLIIKYCQEKVTMMNFVNWIEENQKELENLICEENFNFDFDKSNMLGNMVFTETDFDNEKMFPYRNDMDDINKMNHLIITTSIWKGYPPNLKILVEACKIFFDAVYIYGHISGDGYALLQVEGCGKTIIIYSGH